MKCRTLKNTQKDKCKTSSQQTHRKFILSQYTLVLSLQLQLQTVCLLFILSPSHNAKGVMDGTPPATAMPFGSLSQDQTLPNTKSLNLS